MILKSSLNQRRRAVLCVFDVRAPQTKSGAVLAGRGLLSIPDMLLYKHTGIGFVYNLERTLFAQVHLPDNRLFGRGVNGSTLQRIDSNLDRFDH